MIWSALVMALRAIRRNVLRSTLTGLGIVIGVAAVIAMVSLGEAASASVTGQIAGLGSNMLIVIPGNQQHGPASVAASAFTLADADAIRDVPAVAAVAPGASRSVLAVAGARNWPTSVQGTTTDFFAIRTYRVARGRLFSESEQKRGAGVCILGAKPAHELFGVQDPVGAQLRLGKVPCTVVGVLAAKGQASFGPDQDDIIVTPLRFLQRRLVGNTDVSVIYVGARSGDVTSKAKTQIEGLLNERRHIAPGDRADFSVQDMKEITKTLGVVTGVLTALLGGIAAVSLLVGGIGIMNIMLVSVTERTREIGIRLAIGARAREVLSQFLVEAVVLTTLGGMLGMLLGLGGSYAATRALKLGFVLSPTIVLVAVVFSAAVGIAFGYFPARKAARLNPIEALRYE